jgi:hypothetical protein
VDGHQTRLSDAPDEKSCTAAVMGTW